MVTRKSTSNKSVLAYYRELNDPSLLSKLHKLYINMARIGDLNNYVGIKWQLTRVAIENIHERK